MAMGVFFTLMFGLFLKYAISDEHYIGTYQIKDFILTRCANTSEDPISLDNVTIMLGNEVKPLVTGIFTTTIDLDAPIKVATEMERKFIWWIPMPCVDDLGSCTFDDVCAYAPPENGTCPEVFKNVPCRCPINKGTYVIPETIGNIFEKSPIFTGSYKGTLTISSNDTRLACYDTSFQIYDT